MPENLVQFSVFHFPKLPPHGATARLAGSRQGSDRQEAGDTPRQAGRQTGRFRSVGMAQPTEKALGGKQHFASGKPILRPKATSYRALEMLRCIVFCRGLRGGYDLTQGRIRLNTPSKTQVISSFVFLAMFCFRLNVGMSTFCVTFSTFGGFSASNHRKVPPHWFQVVSGRLI